jgi:TPR repeat protein
MRRVVFAFFLAASLLAGESLVLPDTQQKAINTMQDFIDLEKTLRMASVLDPQKSHYYLGLLYLTEHKLQDGRVIRPDYDKALSFLEKSLEEGNTLAAYNMAMVFLKKGKVDNSIFVLDMTIDSLDDSKKKQRASGAYLSAALASIVLDFKADNQEALQVAIKHLSHYVTLSRMPSGNYLLSQLYLRHGDIDSANRELTRACTSKVTPREIKSICAQLKRRRG